MKKNSTFKVLMVTFFIVVLLSWIIPAGYYQSGNYIGINDTIPVGVYDLVRVPVLTIASFIQYGVLFLAIGGFYGILSKTGVFYSLVDKVSKKYEKKKNSFLVFVVCLFSILSALTGLNYFMFILVPLFTAMLLKLGFNKLNSMTATIGSIIVGNISNILGFNVWGYISYFTGLSMTTYIYVRIILFVMLTVLLILMLLKLNKNDIKKETKKNSKKESKDTKEEVLIPLLESVKTKKSNVPFIVIFMILLIVMFISQYNWVYSFKIDVFSNMYETITNFKIAGYPIFGKLLSGLSEFGFLGNYDLVVMLILSGLLIAWVYNVKMRDAFDGFISGAKEMLPTAIYSMLACVIFASLLNMNDGQYSSNFLNTIVSKLSKTNEFSIANTTLISLFTSIGYNDLYTLMGNYSSLFTINASIQAVLLQGINGLVMLLSPTSILLIAGLTYNDISYKEWIKHIYKYALIALGILIVVTFILTTLI